MVLFLVLAMATGVTALRQTKAIWSMDSPMAVSTNATLNSFGSIESVVIPIVILVVAIFALFSTRRAF